MDVMKDLMPIIMGILIVVAGYGHYFYRKYKKK